jgi:hypothetical protein
MDSHVDDRLFGTIIAYVFPGLVMLWGLSFVSPDVAAWLKLVTSGDTHTAGFLLLAVAAAGLGVCASNARWFMLDFLLKRWFEPPGPNLDHSKRKEEGVERAYQSILLAHYRFYQHAGNTLAALVAASLFWLAGHQSEVRAWLIPTLFALAALILALGARDARHVSYTKQRRLLGAAEGEIAMCDSNGDEGKGYPPPRPRPQPKPK